MRAASLLRTAIRGVYGCDEAACIHTTLLGMSLLRRLLLRGFDAETHNSACCRSFSSGIFCIPAAAQQQEHFPADGESSGYVVKGSLVSVHHLAIWHMPMQIGEIHSLLDSASIDYRDCFEKAELLRRLEDAQKVLPSHVKARTQAAPPV